MRTRVKICGLTREQDIASAVQAGADAIGFVFYPASKRHVDPARAAQLRREVPAFVDVVALFVNPRPDEVQAVLDHVAPDLLQFHGDETPQDCGRYGRRYLRAFRAGAPGLDSAAGLAAACRQYADAAGWLFDSYSAGYGGSGQGSCAIVLAGGLHPGNVADAVRAVRPWAVDVSSGVEDAPGIKSAGKIRQLMAAIKSVDQVAR
ncbi:N-(5'-phosphoribosyl)anthranilate isomerase [Bordetella pertussis]|nr:N-(5'-phosphoribosyl)anthranilate isomerase [Bordetella pertussis]